MYAMFEVITKSGECIEVEALTESDAMSQVGLMTDEPIVFATFLYWI